MIFEEEIPVKTSKGYFLSATKFNSSQKALNHSIVISSATGVLQKYYKKMARHFAAAGYTVYTFDYSGIGKSGSDIKSLKKNTNTLHEWGSIDQASVVYLAKEENPVNKITLITHSVGGQVLGFNPHYHLIDNAVTVASQSGYWKYFTGIHLPKMWLFWHGLIPLLTPVYGYFPAKRLGLFENLPKKMVYEWAKWGKHTDYIMGFYNEDTTYFHKLTIPIMVLSFPKDTYAPKKSVDWLADQFKNAKVDRKHIIPAESGLDEIGHFGFFRDKFAGSLWKMLQEWITKN
ncbi:alpha/beta hydrolase family protein [Abyssalbus ytuae]|uniref:Alpha/beta fold hydrolase n=1 Tax=Abyssalbus ytuae TaxID=2926907 RepID=A0A9E6ZZ55_9FLAO|nr:alpha/beta fold hydrolase [Abyssalbus ytuae]UOB16536.1 alpha/beta fold hydrolase [Abyssalbus ytuae]